MHFEMSKSGSWHASKLGHIVFWSTAILYLLFSPSLRYQLFLQAGKPLEILNTPPNENGEIQYNVEKVDYWSENRVIHEKSETYALRGWAFVNEGPHTQQTDFDRFIVIYDDKKVYIFPMLVASRTDVQDFFKDNGLSGLVSSGFNAVISRNSLPIGEYDIGILFRHTQDDTSYYIQTNRVLMRTPNHLLLKPLSK